jgi:hypothetical protein
MDDQDLERMRFPIGPQPRAACYDAQQVARGIADLEAFPALLRGRAETLSQADLERIYRPGGWTVRQVIHHLADSHLNSYTRFKLALTEDRPVIKPYFEERWAELPDGKGAPIGLSLDILAGVHARLVTLLHTLDETAFNRAFHHPESRRDVYLFENVGIYAWHGRHHLAHIELALQG